MSIALAQQTNYVYTPRATFNWTSRNLNYITISYYGNTAATSNTIVSSNINGQFYTTPDLSLNTLYTFVFTPYNSAGGKGNTKTITVNTSTAISIVNILNATGNVITLQWFGTYSYVKVVGKLTSDLSYSDLSTNVFSSVYSYYNIIGNTNYTFYITPYSTYGTIGTLSNTVSAKTAVQPASNISILNIDSSSILINFTEPANTCNTYYYTFHTVDTNTIVSFDVSGTTPSLRVRDLSGNTNYQMSIITTLNNDSTLTATSNSITSTTAVQPPNTVSTIFYDNSAATVSFIDGRNTYNTVYYSAYATYYGSGVIVSASGSSTPITITNLSGNTTYNLYVKNIINGNTSISASSVIPSTITTNVQPVTIIGNTYIDGSAIAISFKPAINSYTTQTYSVAVTDLSANSITNISSAQPNTSYMISNLIGNTPYFFSVLNTLNGNAILSATSITYNTRTYVQAPTNISIPFYDSSSINLLFQYPTNNYTTSNYYNAYVTDGINTSVLSGTNNFFQFKDLSSNTSYSCYLRTYVTSKSNTISFTTLNNAQDMIVGCLIFT